MKPLSKSEASWKFWREDNPSPDNKNDKFTAWAKKQMRRARRRFFRSEATKEEQQ